MTRSARPTLHWRGTLLYPTALVALFLLLQWLAGWLGIDPAQQAALAALPAVAALVISLPLRVKRCWGIAQPWQHLGVIAPASAVARALLRGVLKALALLALVLICLNLSGDISWQPRLSGALVLNALCLGAGVGFAEELLFRGWLMGELSLWLGEQRALWLQAVVFSMVHCRFDLPPLLLAGLLLGLLLLGLALGLQRRADHNLLWGAVGLHGGLVGGWLALSAGVIVIDPNAPVWLTGPENPIGGVEGVIGLALLVLARHPWWKTSKRREA